MLFYHLPQSSLMAILKTYNIILNTGCKNQDNILRFREECLEELQKRNDLYNKE